MSLILDALRKIELERKARRQGSQDLHREVLMYRGTAPASVKSRIFPSIAALLLLSAAAACFFYFTRPGPVPVKTGSGPQSATSIQEPLMTTPPPPLQPPVEKSLPGNLNVPAPPMKQPATAGSDSPKNGAAGITVSGIAWQDERSLRRAVINGYLVGEGAEIEGAQIVEIKESRVRFSRGGEIFEVVHSSGSGR